MKRMAFYLKKMKYNLLEKRNFSPDLWNIIPDEDVGHSGSFLEMSRHNFPVQLFVRIGIRGFQKFIRIEISWWIRMFFELQIGFQIKIPGWLRSDVKNRRVDTFMLLLVLTPYRYSSPPLFMTAIFFPYKASRVLSESAVSEVVTVAVNTDITGREMKL